MDNTRQQWVNNGLLIISIYNITWSIGLENFILNQVEYTITAFVCLL